MYNISQKVAYLAQRETPFTQEKVQILDQLTEAIKTNNANSKQAHQIWRLLKDDHYFWFNADKVLSFSKIDETKVFMLILLEEAIKNKWLALPQQQREVLKSYIVNLILQYSAVENLSKSMHNILSKCNSILVQIVKYQWNTTWKSFINDICSSSVKDMNVCENNFYILKMLSQQIFDYSKNQMTQHQIVELKQQMNSDFTTIFELCKFILQNMLQAKQSLVRACLQTLNAFLSWIPMYYIMYTDLIDKLVLMIPSDYLRNHSLACLVQIASLGIDENNQQEKNKYLFMLQSVTQELNKLIPLENQDDKIQQILNSVKKRNRNIFQILSRGIANFYSEFFKNQHRWLSKKVEGQDNLIKICHYGFKYLIMMMKIDKDQVFKITIQFFHFYIGSYLNFQTQQSSFGSTSYVAYKGSTLEAIYNDIFGDVMKIICLKMAKPQEVLIVIDQDGIPVREEMENTENSSLYEIQKQLAMYLVRYNWVEMKKFIIQQIEKQHIIEYFSFDTLNSLSWIVGSLCGSMQDREQRQFFVTTLRTLLQLCEMKKGKQNKAVIASCIMYVVGQYPTFLKSNWTFLKTVIKKLFQFMKEQFPGIMEMACNAFLKIAKSTSDQFTINHQGESEPYIRDVIRKIPEYTKKLTNDTLQFVFYESIGYLIEAEVNTNVQLELMKETLGIYLYEFNNIITSAQENQNILKEEALEKKIIYFLKLNQMLAVGVGKNYTLMLELISETLNKIYLFYSTEVNQSVNINGKIVLNYMSVRAMRVIKKEVIKIYTKLLQKSQELNEQQANYILTRFIFPLGPLLKDFQDCIPQTKEQQFVALFTAVLEKLHIVISSEFLLQVIQMIFSSSLPLITSDFNSFPQIRANFFSFLKALIKFNFGNLFSLGENYFNTVLDCIIWSIRHELSNYSDLGLDLLEEILLNVNKNEAIANAFYSRYHMKILTEILDVMTDGFHKSGIQSQAKILYILIHVLTNNWVVDPISPDKPANISNSQFLFNFLVQKLSTTFSNVSSSLTNEKVKNLFQQQDEKLFKLQIGDYLILINRFCQQDLNENIQKK